MVVKEEEEESLASETAKQTFFHLVLEIAFVMIFGNIVSRLTSGLALLIGGPIIYYVNADQTIGVVFGIALPLIGLLMIISKIREISKDIKKEVKAKP